MRGEDGEAARDDGALAPRPIRREALGVSLRKRDRAHTRSYIEGGNE